MDASLLTHGVQAPETALALNRIAIGIFFACSGANKLFNPGRHATLRQTLHDDGVPGVGLMQWLVPGVEFAGGSALALGLLSALAAFGLFVIVFTALCLDAVKRIADWQPINRADWVADLLYLPETLYCIALTVVMLAGPGGWRLDTVVQTFLAA